MSSKPRSAAVVAAITAMLIVSACAKSESSNPGTSNPPNNSGNPSAPGSATTARPGPPDGPATSAARGSTSTVAAGATTTTGQSASTSSSSAAGPTPTYGENDTNISAATNGRFAIRLKSNASTGYSWKYKTDATNLKLLSETTEPPSSDAIGAGGAQVFTFEATAPGTATLIFAYARGTPSADDSTLRYIVSIS